MKVLDSIWFSPMLETKIIGIVKCEVEYEGIKYYIGTAMGGSQEHDAIHIAQHGATFPSDAAEKLFS